MLIHQAPVTKATEHVRPSEAVLIEERELSLPDQAWPPPESRMFAVALLLSAAMLLVIGVGVVLVWRAL